jgi:hypothetical protein
MKRSFFSLHSRDKFYSDFSKNRVDKFDPISFYIDMKEQNIFRSLAYSSWMANKNTMTLRQQKRLYGVENVRQFKVKLEKQQRKLIAGI